MSENGAGYDRAESPDRRDAPPRGDRGGSRGASPSRENAGDAEPKREFEDEKELNLKAFVGGIPHAFTDEDLNAEFADFNSTRAEVMCDKYTGKSRGFGFVFFSSEEDRAAAIEAKNKTFMQVCSSRARGLPAAPARTSAGTKSAQQPQAPFPRPRSLAAPTRVISQRTASSTK
ncbi:unnamed protein product [Pedinophyceae sp. YPF-701]|nr:unnamed protein product [Pedinophyceae sp. YPF-701]